MTAKLKGINEVEDSAPGEQPKGKNIFIGIAIDYDYDGSELRLYNPVKDLIDLADLLRQEFFSENDIIDCELVNDKATHEAINSRLEKLIGAEGSEQELEIGENDNLIIYFSGHGFWNAKTKTTHLVPVDGVRGKVTTFIPAAPFVNDLLSHVKCRHLLLILDCCFSGAVAKETLDELKNLRIDDKIPASPPRQEASFPDALQDVFYRKSRRILTAGWLEPVSDGQSGKNSPFAKALLQCLRENGDLNLLALANQIRPIVLANGGGSVVSFSFDPANHQEGEYVFFRRDTGRPLPVQLRNALLNLNFSEQRKESIDFNIPFLFNLIYLHGTEKCGHHLFLHHFLKEQSQSFDLYNAAPYYFRLGVHEGEKVYKDLWELLSCKYCGATGRLPERQVVENLLKKLTNEHCMVVLKTGKRPNEDEPIEKTLYDFWVKFNEVLQLPDLVVPPNLFNRFFLFVLDRRGEEAVFDRAKFQEIVLSEHAGTLCCTSFQPVDRDKDLKGWVFKHQSSIEAKKFSDLRANLQIFEQKQFVEEAILRICTQCERIECYDQIFLKKWIE